MDPVFHFIEYLRRNIPGIKLVEKKKSPLMRFLGFLCFFNKEFMRNTVTVWRKTIYLPSAIPHDLGLMQVIAHEYVHIADMKRMGSFKFMLLYLFPQSFVLAPLLVLCWGVLESPLSYFCSILVLILGLIPGYAPWRIEYEQKAYAMTLLFDLWVRGYTSPAVIDKIVDILHGSTYYWPGGNKQQSKFYFEIVLEDARRGILPVGEEFRDVYNYLEEEKYLVKPVPQI